MPPLKMDRKPTRASSRASYRAVQSGDCSEIVEILQQRLNQTLLPPAYPLLVPLRVDGVFGEKTERRVKLAQFRYLLLQDGIANEMTWRSLEQDAALVSEFPTLQRYSLGPSVGAVQQLLKTAGLYAGRVNQRFDEQTETAIRDFQSMWLFHGPMLGGHAQGRVDGIVDETTWVALEKLAIFQLFA